MECVCHVCANKPCSCSAHGTDAFCECPVCKENDLEKADALIGDLYQSLEFERTVANYLQGFSAQVSEDSERKDMVIEALEETVDFLILLMKRCSCGIWDIR